MINSLRRGGLVLAIASILVMAIVTLALAERKHVAFLEFSDGIGTDATFIGTD